MSNARIIVGGLLRRGAVVWSENGSVRCRAAKGTVGPADLEQLRTWKTEIVDFLDAVGVNSPDLSEVEAMRRCGTLPLSFAQERLWFIDQLSPNGTAYNIGFGLALEGPLLVRALEEALAEIVHRHESLRTRFGTVGDDPVQVIDTPDVFHLAVQDISNIAADEQAEHASQIARLEFETPFNLSEGPVFRATLIRLAAQSHQLLVAAHHIAVDGWSLGLFQNELFSLYAANSIGHGSPLPALPHCYADYAFRQRQTMRGDHLAEQFAYWKGALSGAPGLIELPTDRPRPTQQSFRGASHAITLTKAQREALQLLANSENASLFMVLLASYNILLWRLTGQTDVVVGTPSAGRTLPETEPLIGLFINTLALHARIRGDSSFREHLRSVRDVALGAFAHQDIPFERIVQELTPERSLSHPPIVQVMLVMQGSSRNAPAEPSLPGLTHRIFGGQGTAAKFDLTLVVTETPDGLHCDFDFATDLFDSSTIERFAGHFVHLIEQIVVRCDAPLTELRLLTHEQHRRIVTDWNATLHPVSDATFPDLFERQAKGAPDAVALVFEDTTLSYAELNARANRLAHLLMADGIGPEQIVGIALPRSLDLIVALLGVAKAGAAYLPLDPQYPTERLAFMVGNALPALLITHSDLAGRLPDGPIRILLDSPELQSRLPRLTATDPRDQDRVVPLDL